MHDPDLLMTTQEVVTKRSNVEIRQLICHNPITKRDVSIPDDVTEQFAAQWVKTPPPENAKTELQSYTFDPPIGASAGTIRKKRPAEEACGIDRGTALVDAQAVLINWADIQEESIDHPGYIFRIERSIGTQQVCGVVEQSVQQTEETLAALPRNNSDLFNVYTVKIKRYFAPTSKYLLAEFQWLLPSSWYKYDKQTLEFTTAQYELICVVHRTGRGSRSGHYFASLKLGQRWYIYNDGNTRRELDTPDRRAFPYLLLFRRFPDSA
jgi:hypothetical protein